VLGRAGLGWAAVTEARRDAWAVPDDVSLVWAPLLAVGLSPAVELGSVELRPEAAGLLTAGPRADEGIAWRPGGALGVGVVMPAGPLSVLVEGRGGWAGGVLGQLGLGVEVAL
jgi:hypothetical protein